jgi:hypothetical protein
MNITKSNSAFSLLFALSELKSSSAVDTSVITMNSNLQGVLLRFKEVICKMSYVQNCSSYKLQSM